MCSMHIWFIFLYRFRIVKLSLSNSQFCGKAKPSFQYIIPRKLNSFTKLNFAWMLRASSNQTSWRTPLLSQ